MLQRLTNHVLPAITLPECVTPESPDRYTDPITTDGYLQQRPAEIGLKK